MAAAPRLWIRACEVFAAAHAIAPQYLGALDAFAYPNPRGGPPPPPEPRFDGEFGELEATLLADTTEVLRVRLAIDLAAEVDQAQAQMFARRFVAVDAMLAGFQSPTARLLRVGLRQRLVGIVAASRPRALRIRALADFYYTYAGLHHAEQSSRQPVRTVQQQVSGLAWRQVARGLDHALLEGVTQSGPLRVNVLRAQPGSVALEVVDCRSVVARGEPFAAFVRDTGAVAAVSGGFFLYSEPDIEPPSHRFDPVGLLVCAGEVTSPPVFRRGALVVDEAGEWLVAPIGMENLEAWHPSAGELALDACVTRARSSIGPDRGSAAIVGHTVTAVGRSLAVPLNGFVVPVSSTQDVQPGDVVRYTLPRVEGRVLQAGVAGGPMLLRDGALTVDLRAEDFWGTAPPVTFSQDETGDRNLLPRLAAGTDPAGCLFLAAVDGRNLELSLGMTLAGVGELMAALGCSQATNLDGGSSKRMVVEGLTLDAPSTEMETTASVSGVAVRPVHTALLLRAKP